MEHDNSLTVLFLSVTQLDVDRLHLSGFPDTFHASFDGVAIPYPGWCDTGIVKP